MQQREPVFRKPYWKDWTLWLATVAVLAGLTSANAGGSILDVPFIVAFQFALFGYLPAIIRRMIRERRTQ